jgi:hypothetical protein
VNSRYDPTPWGLFDFDALDEQGDETMLAGPFADQALAIQAAARFQRSPETGGQHRLGVRRLTVPRDQRPVRVPREIAVASDGSSKPWHGQVTVTVDGEPFPYVIKDVQLTDHGGIPAVRLTVVADKVTWLATAATPINPLSAP